MNDLFFSAFFVAIALSAFLLPMLFDGNLFSQWIPLILLFLVFLAWIQVFFFDRRRDSQGTVLLMFFAVIGGLSSLLRWIPMPMGASAFFFLPLMVAHVMGPSFGATVASLAMLMSGFIGGGLGPWLPYQVLASGIFGMICGFTVGRSKVTLMIATFFSALLYGVLMNLWFWPTLESIEGGYWAFYMTTSAIWDLSRAIALVILIAVFFRPIHRILVRYRNRLFQ